ncbi:MAG: DUF3368 domain-containing protein [Clostridia bacterium]|nr:DUF3368 domain-containing protein [Clostridia bacterium]
MRKVIVNSTPIIVLAKVRKLNLLEQLYGEVTIPDAVMKEVTRKNDMVRNLITASSWIHVEKIHSTDDRAMYKAKLHDGEVEVMILAQEHGEDHLVIIDDDAARKTALYLNLNLTGTLGVLLKAKEKGLLPNVMPVIEAMEREGLYLGRTLKERIKRLAKE